MGTGSSCGFPRCSPLDDKSSHEARGQDDTGLDLTTRDNFRGDTAPPHGCRFAVTSVNKMLVFHLWKQWKIFF